MSKTTKDVFASSTNDLGPWDHSRDVLSLKTFPSTSILRWGRKGEHLCSCKDYERHRSLFTVNLQFVAPSLLGRGECPNLKVCFNAENMWECRLPREITGLDKRVVFERLPTVRHAIRVLKKGSYWFPRLLKGKKLKTSAFGRKMVRLLAGCSSAEGPEPFGSLKGKRVSPIAVQRLRSMLATADGVLMQAVLGFPGNHDFQNWKRMDQIQCSLVANLISDYFRDNDPDRVSTFEKVKQVRKDLKRELFNPIGSPAKVVVPRELSVMRTMCSLIRGKTPLAYFQGMMLTQTRAGGVPPPSVYTKTLAKTKAILTEPSDKTLYNNVARPLAKAVDLLYGDFLTRLGSIEKRDSFFEGIMKEAKISLSDSGEFFTTTNVGGKLEAARIVLQTNPEIREINLHSGEVTDRIIPIKPDNQGERLFHWALGTFVDRQKVYDRNCMSCRISLVAELGKFRTITVSTLQHAILLHPVSHLGLKILEVFPSSESGIGAANHAWNLFKRLSHKNPSASFIFKQDIKSAVFSTDWENATDYGDRYISGLILNRFLNLIGVPKWYRETVVFALTAPRQVETLDKNGCPIEWFYTTRGILMGDPVTKVVLHLFHLVGRRMTEELLHQIFKEKVFDDSSDEE